ncbi:uncharacterized protein BJX67DRAFT_350668 [Aspergillus lucknowensis]|uniref:Uncharacterized protein n=1 Tax=Aspergillus lucknowensis TaxID=176173 RepID=A0ABR4LV60_9EURO
MNHPLPPKPPISMYFHTYTPPARKPATALGNMAAQHVDHGKSIPVNNNRERPFAHHHATASSIGVLSSPYIESIIHLSSKDMIPRLENNCDKTSNINNNGDNLPHPDKLFSWI